MRVLITGICGFVGQVLATGLREHVPGLEIIGLDNLIRPGSEQNRASLTNPGVKFIHADLRVASDLEALPATDWVIDAAANASVLAGVDGQVASRQLVEHNLGSTINLLEYCKRHRAGFILMSTSRVYSIAPLANLQMEVVDRAFRPRVDQQWPSHCSPEGVAENFSTSPPISLYGSTKLASESLALEYGHAFGFSVWINRCGVLAGAGQFGRADQGIFSFWIHSFARKRSLKYIGFDGGGHQVRDCLHPRDLIPVVTRQFVETPNSADAVLNFSGGMQNSMSLRQLSDWCSERFGSHEVASDAKPRPFDLPWMVLDSRVAEKRWAWQRTPLEKILEEIAQHAGANPRWMDLTAR